MILSRITKDGSVWLTNDHFSGHVDQVEKRESEW